MSDAPHADDELARFLDGSLEDDQRQAFEERASREPQLRARLAAAYRQRQAERQELPVPPELLRRGLELGAAEAAASAPWWSTSRSARRRFGGGLAAAATLAVLVGAGWWLVVGPSPPAPLLDDTPRTAPLPVAVELLEPAAGARLTSRELELSWQPVATAIEYLTEVVDERGDLVARTTSATPSCLLELPDTVRPPAGGPTRTLFWYVTARLPDGSTVASELRDVVVASSGP